MKILVTGGCGFIGSHLVDALIGMGHVVYVIDDLSTGKRDNLNSRAQLIEGNIITPGIFDSVIQDVDFCFHLAAIASVERSRKEWLYTHQVNASGTVALFDAIVRSGKKTPVVYASSAAVYGNGRNSMLREDMRLEPITAYGADKLACEYAGSVAALIHEIPNVGLRFFNVYGPRQDPKSPYSGVISIFCDQLRQGKPVTIYGTGEQSRDFVYVGDVVNALVGAMSWLKDRNRTHNVFNVCTGKPTTVQELIQILSDVFSIKPVILYQESRRGDIRKSLGQPEKAIEFFDFKAKINLRMGIKKLINF